MQILTCQHCRTKVAVGRIAFVPAAANQRMMFRFQRPMISIDLKADSTEQAKSLMRLLDENKPLKIVIGDYDKEAQSFISPESPEGQLRTMEWQAVPALIAALENEQLSFRKRAWILTLLYSITLEYELSPIESETQILPSGILPDYEKKRNACVLNVQERRSVV